jgi:hypothetical protein
MVEGDKLYKYSGTNVGKLTNAPWAWTETSTIAVDWTGYTYKWSLTLGTSTKDTKGADKIVV